MRQDAAGLRFIQAHGPQHPALEAFLISEPVALLVDVQGFAGVFAEHAGGTPGFEQSARPRILVRTLVVTGFVACPAWLAMQVWSPPVTPEKVWPKVFAGCEPRPQPATKTTFSMPPG